MAYEPSTQKRVRGWFEAKRRELLASADLAEDHTGLIGGHREIFVREFLAKFLPGRFSADRGIVYSSMDRTGECDVVIWDSTNFPRLAMLDHSSFFVESVVTVVEVKSRYSKEEFDECRKRNKQLRHLSMLSPPTPLRLEGEIDQIWAYIKALQDGTEYEGTLRSHRSIAYVTVFLKGGGNVTLDGLIGNTPETIEDSFPDVVAFVEDGKFIVRHEPTDNGFERGEIPELKLYDEGDDILMSLADELLKMVLVRSLGTDGLYGLGMYDPRFKEGRYLAETVEYALTRFPVMRRHIFDPWPTQRPEAGSSTP